MSGSKDKMIGKRLWQRVVDQVRCMNGTEEIASVVQGDAISPAFTSMHVSLYPLPPLPMAPIRRIEWLPGKLEEEVNQGMWIPAACARSLVLKQCILLPKPLW